ncbi:MULTISPECIES: ABC transporter permease [Gordonia]|uniref:Phospholipid/cholesterol/gamma-HCH transport system permease protein n=1 Tax=Gordonia westfalica TaxID=158898 RepID=A0A1H2KLY1_9ACTN|nr:ABC transporter permease [Gordonia sp. GONU]ASR01245.1 putative phospholipid ABC transporter permease protein MlaE [Gordonia rubripertincta]SDU69361.1 phospholipid/cholesterol/gamma-HCH transport system permease protein [Gordonia westfalica]
MRDLQVSAAEAEILTYKDEFAHPAPPSGGGVGAVAARAGARTVEYLRTVPKASIATMGRAATLTADVVRYSVTETIRMRLPMVETLEQAWFLLTVTALPAVLIALPFGTEISIQVGAVVNQVGAKSLAGAASGIGVISQGAPIAAGLLMGGAAASAIAADLGARSIREEIDAMRVMGVDPVQRLVLPRFLAILLISPILCVIIVASAVAAGFVLAVSINGVIPGSFWQSFGAFATQTDFYFAILKTMLFGMEVVIIASLRGLEAKGGPRGVADSVNASVVLGFVAVFVTNLMTTQLQTMFFPSQVG